MPTDTPASVLRELDAACPCADDERKGCSYRNGISCHCVTHGLGHHKCGWPGHALARKLARVSQETTLHDAQQCSRCRNYKAHILRGVTVIDNQKKTHCVRGHQYEDENTRWKIDSWTGHKSRSCRTCERDGYQKRKLAIAALDVEGGEE